MADGVVLQSSSLADGSWSVPFPVSRKLEREMGGAKKRGGMDAVVVFEPDAY